MRSHLLLIALTILLNAASVANCQDWAKAMFSDTSHDFGVVARGAKAEYKIAIENIYEEEAHITSVRSSCGCTTPKIDKKTLKTWEKAELSLTIDTRSFLGQREATISVNFDQPLVAEVQVHVHAYIRSDVVIQPGVIQFGTVNQGIAMKQKVTISYAGRDDWRIDRVESASPYLEGKLTELSRGDSRVKYELWTILKADAPVGYIKDQMVLVTNDFQQRSAKVPVAVEGVVEASLSVRPSPLFLGIVEADKTVTRPLVLQGKTPFNITSVKCSDPRFQCKLPEGAKTVQLLPVTFNAKDATDKVNAKLKIETDYPNAKPIDLDVNVQVKPKTVTSSPNAAISSPAAAEPAASKPLAVPAEPNTPAPIAEPAASPSVTEPAVPSTPAPISPGTNDDGF